MILVKNLESITNQKWSTTDKYPGVRWKFLIDADFTQSSELSIIYLKFRTIKGYRLLIFGIKGLIGFLIPSLYI